MTILFIVKSIIIIRINLLFPLFKVNIIGLYSADDNQVVNFDRPVKSVAIDPFFYKSSSKQFVTGDDKLILNERGFLRSHKTRVLHQGEGAIRQIKWKGELVAWANDFVRIVL
jgi:hypothetical protein